jgi:DNA-binding response OmpR family regulator
MPNGTILIADDEIHIRHVVGQRLRSAGYTVIEAGDGKEALELALEHIPDMVISDLQMPTMSGLELCTQLRDNASTSHIPAILLTARGYLIEESHKHLTNVRAIVAKPFSVREILERIDSLRVAA